MEGREQRRGDQRSIRREEGGERRGHVRRHGSFEHDQVLDPCMHHSLSVSCMHHSLFSHPANGNTIPSQMVLIHRNTAVLYPLRVSSQQGGTAPSDSDSVLKATLSHSVSQHMRFDIAKSNTSSIQSVPSRTRFRGAATRPLCNVRPG
eukprot:113600-Rhodomonas_salina.1